MADSGSRLGRRPIVGLSLGLLLAASLIPAVGVSAAATITKIDGSPVSISADTNGNTGSGTYTTLTGPAINGSGPGDIAAGKVVLTLPDGFEYKPSPPAATATFSGGGCGGLSASAISYSAGNSKASTTLTGGSSSGSCTLTFSGLKVRPVSGNPLRSGNITNTGTTGPSGSYGTLVTVAGVAHHLVFSTYPRSPTAALLAPQPAVAVVDMAGNVVPVSRSVTLTINKNLGTFSCFGQAAGTPAVITSVNGIATFTNCVEATVAAGYRLTANSTGLLSTTGALFDVTSGVPTQLALCWGPKLPCVTTPPTPVKGGTSFTAQPVVRIQDSLGNQVPNDETTQVTLGIVAGTPISGGPGTLFCSSGNTVTAVDGVATFAGCRIDKVGTGYRLAATSTPALTGAASSPFDVEAGPPIKIAFLTQPTTTAARSPFNPPLSVAIQDAGGNTVTSGTTATIALSMGTNPVAASLSCTGGAVATTVNGVATFTGCSVSGAGTGFTIVATASNVSPPKNLGTAQTNPFTITAPGAVITVSASAPTIIWAQTVVISVHFGINGANKSFRLEGARDPNNLANFSLIANLTTNASGDASISYTPPTNLYYRAVFAGTPDLSPAISPLTRVVVRQISLLRPTNNGATRTVKAGTSILFTTTVRPSRPELTPAVVVYTVFQLKNGTWVQILARNVTATAAGIAQLSITFSTKGSFYVRSQANPTPYNANSVNSPVERYNVN